MNCCHCRQPLAADPLLVPGAVGLHEDCAKEQARVTKAALRLCRILRKMPGMTVGHCYYWTRSFDETARLVADAALRLPWFREQDGRYFLTEHAPEVVPL